MRMTSGTIRPFVAGSGPQDSEVAIQRLWHKCVQLSVELSQKKAKHRETRGKLSTAAGAARPMHSTGAVVVGENADPLLLEHRPRAQVES